jgi:formamidopyrimidine-DNA glycosylase
MMASGALLVALMAAGCSSEPPPPPPQPIAFNHSVHAENDIDCTRCHQGVETQAQAGLPAMATCATCHRREATDHPEVVRFMEQYASGNGEPMVWRKVNVMPTSAMVHFKHKPHIRAGVDCTSCHGDVTQMTVAQRVINTASMGWCLDCHKEQNASIDCLTCHH